MNDQPSMADAPFRAPLEPKTYFVNIYSPVVGACGAVYETRALADQMAGRGRLACKEIYVLPGEGIERGDCKIPGEV